MQLEFCETRQNLILYTIYHYTLSSRACLARPSAHDARHASEGILHTSQMADAAPLMMLFVG